MRSMRTMKNVKMAEVVKRVGAYKKEKCKILIVHINLDIQKRIKLNLKFSLF